jgi:hypothetical protein
MKSAFKFRTTTSTLFVLFAFGWFALCPLAEAVLPPPDGSYPGFNTAEGQNALFSLTTGVGNAAVGWFSLFSNTDGSFNTAVGAGTLLFNVGEPSTSAGIENTAVGAAALLFNTTGDSNTAVGAAALLNNTEGVGNTAIGVSALSNNSDGSNNTATGEFAMSSSTEGSDNTANGVLALFSNTNGSSNTATGIQALSENTTGFGNTAVGGHTLRNNTEGDFNTATGFNALANNTTGLQNTANGSGALGGNTTGSGNIAVGVAAGSNVTDANNVICIGISGANVDDSCFIGNIYQKQVGNDSLPVRVDSSGKLGTEVSSRRFKRDIKPMDEASKAILALKPVTFHYSSDNTNAPQFGLIAEEVAKVNADLVVRDKNGQVYTVRYDAVNAMLLNEFLKEHRKVREHEATIALLKRDSAKQQKQIEALTAGLRRVSDQIQLTNPAPHLVSND